MDKIIDVLLYIRYIYTDYISNLIEILKLINVDCFKRINLNSKLYYILFA